MRFWRLPVPILGAMLLGATSSTPGAIRVGGVTASAFLTATVTATGVVLLPRLLGRRVALLRPLRWWVAFLAWAAALGMVHGVPYDGLQNLTVYALFGLVVAVAAVWGPRHDLAIRTWMLRIGWLIAAIFALATVIEGAGAQTYFAARVFGIQALIFMALAVPAPRDSRWHRALPWVLLLLVASSLSRTATLAAVLLLIVRAAHGRSGRHLWRSIAAAAAGAVVAAWAVVSLPVLNERVFGGDASLSVGGLDINATGRTAIWHELTRDMGRGPLIGHGPGAASTRLKESRIGADEPHNDYLRVLYDYGWIGVVLFAAGLGTLLRESVRRSWRADLDSAAPHTAAALAIAALAIVMVTDNVLIYSWAMAPAAVLVGLSLGATGCGSAATRRQPAVRPDLVTRSRRTNSGAK